MKLPRNMDGTQLARLLGRFGYVMTRQAGSHMRLTTHRNGEHHITIPAHNPMRIGTLNSVIGDVSSHLEISKEELLSQLLA